MEVWFASAGIRPLALIEEKMPVPKNFKQDAETCHCGDSMKRYLEYLQSTCRSIEDEEDDIYETGLFNLEECEGFSMHQKLVLTAHLKEDCYHPVVQEEKYGLTSYMQLLGQLTGYFPALTSRVVLSGWDFTSYKNLDEERRKDIIDTCVSELFTLLNIESFSEERENEELYTVTVCLIHAISALKFEAKFIQSLAKVLNSCQAANSQQKKFLYFVNYVVEFMGNRLLKRELLDSSVVNHSLVKQSFSKPAKISSSRRSIHDICNISASALAGGDKLQNILLTRKDQSCHGPRRLDPVEEVGKKSKEEKLEVAENGSFLGMRIVRLRNLNAGDAKQGFLSRPEMSEVSSLCTMEILKRGRLIVNVDCLIKTLTPTNRNSKIIPSQITFQEVVVREGQECYLILHRRHAVDRVVPARSDGARCLFDYFEIVSSVHDVSTHKDIVLVFQTYREAWKYLDNNLGTHSLLCSKKTLLFRRHDKSWEGWIKLPEQDQLDQPRSKSFSILADTFKIELRPASVQSLMDWCQGDLRNQKYIESLYLSLTQNELSTSLPKPVDWDKIKIHFYKVKIYSNILLRNHQDTFDNFLSRIFDSRFSTFSSHSLFFLCPLESPTSRLDGVFTERVSKERF